MIQIWDLKILYFQFNIITKRDRLKEIARRMTNNPEIQLAKFVL